MLIAPFKNEPFDLFDTESAKADMQRALKKVRSEFGQTYPLLINGERVQTEAKLVATRRECKDRFPILGPGFLSPTEGDAFHNHLEPSNPYVLSEFNRRADELCPCILIIEWA